MFKCRYFFFILIAIMALASDCLAIPTQFGESGLISQPSAETLNSGNICVGIIGNCSDNRGQTTTVLPYFMTLGLGNFLEAYGSYPNILFNDKEEESQRGFANVGMKLRLLGKRSSQFKFSLDGQVRQTVSTNIIYDGLKERVVRAVSSYNFGKFGIHGNFGYIKPESPLYIKYDKQLVYGGGVEYMPTSRMRLLTEVGIETEKREGLSDRAEVTAGFQYFLSPHLTVSLAVAKGYTDESPDWRVLFGFSSCQGIGTYQRVVERKVIPPSEQPVETPAEVKVLKVRTLKSLSPKKKVVAPAKTTSKYDVPVGENPASVILIPSVAPGTASALAASTGTPLLQVAPTVSASLAATALALPASDAAPAGSDEAAARIDGQSFNRQSQSGPFAALPTEPLTVIAYKKFRIPASAIFADDEATLTDEGKLAITEVAEAIKSEKGLYALRVDWFTDNLGSDDYNIKMGMKRAIAVASYMVTNNGIDPARILVNSSGEKEPIETNETEEGRALNRRTEILLFTQKDDR